jgi:hypothetical protein
MRISLLRRLFIRNLSLNNVKSTPAPVSGSASPSISVNSEFMKKIDPKSLSKVEQMYIEKLNKRNTERFEKEKRLRKHYRIVGTFLFGFVLSVYFYTMYAISQEKFLDDFEVPSPPDPAADKLNKKK